MRVAMKILLHARIRGDCNHRRLAGIDPLSVQPQELAQARLRDANLHYAPLPRALDRPRRHRRVLRPRARQSRSAAADRHALPRRARIPARARLRPRAAGGGDLDPGRQHRLRDPGAARWRSARDAHDVCALPYGINTVSLFAHVFLVMLPAKALAEQAGVADPARVAWQAGLLATLCLRHHRARGRVRRRARPQGDAARGAALDARGHRARLHLARLPVPHVRASGDRPDRRSRS